MEASRRRLQKKGRKTSIFILPPPSRSPHHGGRHTRLELLDDHGGGAKRTLRHRQDTRGNEGHREGGRSAGACESALHSVGLEAMSCSPVAGADLQAAPGGGASGQNHLFRDQLGSTDAGSWQIADRYTVASPAAHRTAVGDFRVRFVVELYARNQHPPISQKCELSFKIEMANASPCWCVRTTPSV